MDFSDCLSILRYIQFYEVERYEDSWYIFIVVPLCVYGHSSTADIWIYLMYY